MIHRFRLPVGIWACSVKYPSFISKKLHNMYIIDTIATEICMHLPSMSKGKGKSSSLREVLCWLAAAVLWTQTSSADSRVWKLHRGHTLLLDSQYILITATLQHCSRTSVSLASLCVQSREIWSAQTHTCSSWALLSHCLVLLQSLD